MFKHYLTTALRHFRQHKLTTSINVICLTIGLTCFLAIYATVTYLSSSDQYFDNAARVYLITTKASDVPFNPVGPWPLANYLKPDIPELKTIARATIDVGMMNEIPVSTEDRKGFVTVAYADAEFLDVFALTFEAGDARNALRAPNSVVLGRDAAIRLFGSAQAALNKQLRLQGGREVTVRGVVGDIRQPSHIKVGGTTSFASVRFEALISMDVFEHDIKTDRQRSEFLTNWNVPYFLTYVVLPSDGSFTLADLRERLSGFGKRHADSGDDVYRFDVTPLSTYKLTMFSGYMGTEKTGLSVAAMFYLLGALVLLISCLNYANLAAAHAHTRAKEIGMRRVVGASRVQIITQFMFEAALLSCVAFLCSLVIGVLMLVALAVPGMADIARGALVEFEFWAIVIALLVSVTVAAGLYPAFILSNVRPALAMRAAKVRSGGRFMPRLLVGLQFMGASFLLISMLVMMNQNATLKQAVLNGHDNAMVVLSNDIRGSGVDMDVLRAELLQRPHIQAVTASQFSPWALPAMPTSIARSRDTVEGKIPTTQSIVNRDFFATMSIKLLAGRLFDLQYADDETETPISAPRTRVSSVVIDRTLAEQSGWVRPEDAIGKPLYATRYGSTSSPPIALTVIGVVENHPIGIVSPIGATGNLYLFSTVAASFPIIRISAGDGAAALKEIESVWIKLSPSVPLKMQFADEQLNAAYMTMNLLTTTFVGIATLALLISILGLVGMSIQIIGRRLHEIGVRKTLGASVRSIVHLLLSDFSKPVIVANVLAWPLAYFAMKLYLNMFVQRTGLSAGPFVLSLAMTLLIACLSVAGQASRAARANPGTVLRNE